MRPERLVPVKWRLPECARIILPVLVILKRLAAPRCVFSFFFGLVEFLGIAETLSRTGRRSLQQNPWIKLSAEVGRSDAARYSLRRLRGWLRTWFCRRGALLGRQQRDQYVAFHSRHRLNLAVLADLAQQTRHLGAAYFLVGHLAATVKNHGAHFVAFTEKANNLVLANLIIVLRGGRPKLNFLQLRAPAALALLMRLLILLIKKFAVVGDFANRRVGGGRNFHQVESFFAGQTDGLVRLHDPKLRAFFVDHPDFARPNAFIDARTIALPEAAFCDISP